MFLSPYQDGSQASQTTRSNPDIRYQQSPEPTTDSDRNTQESDFVFTVLGSLDRFELGRSTAASSSASLNSIGPDIYSGNFFPISLAQTPSLAASESVTSFLDRPQWIGR